MSPAGRYAKIPTGAIEDPDLTHAAFRVLAALLSYADADGWCHPKQVTLGERLGMDRSTVASHLDQLRELGYLETEKRGKLNHCHVLTHSTRSSIKYVDPLNASNANVLTHSTRKAERVESLNTNVLSDSTPEHNHVEQGVRTGKSLSSPRPGSSGSVRGSAAPHPPEIDEAAVDRLLTQFAEPLGGSDLVRDTIALALSHQNARKYSNLELYVKRWLQRDVQQQEERAHGAPGRQSSPRSATGGAGTPWRHPRFANEPDDGYVASCGL
jgi:DNA-binding MarR family transcriptional regulator